MSSVVIGIDLGTTNSCVAYIKDGKVELIEDETYGTYLIPSVVTFGEEKKILVGTSAVDVAHKYKAETIYEAKRLIGQTFDDPKVQEDIRKFPFVVKNDFDSPKIVIKNKEWDKELYVEDISMYVLKYLVDTAQNRLKKSITEAVITIPAYFGNEQRTATKDAASLAGIKTTHIINEPTAAALAFQFVNSSKFDRNLLIYDFGGGTFDVCVVHTRDRHCETLAVDGDCHLGGTDIDSNIITYVKENILEKCGLRIEDDDWKTYRRLKNFAEQAKKHLSDNYKYENDVFLAEHKIMYEIKITRQQFEKLNRHLFQKTVDLAEKCVADAKLNKDQIDQIILVGGSSRIPLIREMLKASFGDKVNVSVNPDQMVAYGAAVYASTIDGNKKEITFLDVLTLSLGTDVKGNKMSNIIDRNTSLPCEKSKKYATAYDNQTEMTVKIYQGERVLASQNALLGEVCINDLTEAPVGKVIVEVKFFVNEEGILKVSAKELNTDNIKNLDIDMKNMRTSKTDIEQRIKEAEAERESDQIQVLFTNRKAEFEYFCETLEDAASKREDSNDILRQIDSARSNVESLSADQISEIDEITKRLSQLFESK